MEAFEVYDPDAMGIYLFGLSTSQLRRIVDFYKARTGDIDCERIEFFTKGM